MITITLPPNICFVNYVIEKTRLLLENCGFMGTPELAVLQRELLMNAIIHCNKNDPEKAIRCCIDFIDNNKVKLVVENDGNGFDYENMNMTLPANPRENSNNGYILIDKLSDKITIHEKGNGVCQ
jgi:anti-sigma regulatory factor (Ser/Thr protein kinase)